FEDFQKRFPHSSLNRERFVRFAYVSRDRDAVRKILVANPRLRVAPPIKEWAFETTPAALPSERILLRTSLDAGAPGRGEHPLIFAVNDSGKVIGVSATAHTGAFRKWTSEGGEAVTPAISIGISTGVPTRTAVFEPNVNLRLMPLHISQ